MAAYSAADRPAAINVGLGERIASVVAGAALVLRAFRHPTPGHILGALGGALLVRRGVEGHCVVYGALGVKTTLRERAEDDFDTVLRASEDSFPASDPPSWTPVAGSRAWH